MSAAIPQSVIDALGEQVEGVTFGKICLEISIHDGYPKYRITREISVVVEKTTTGAVHGLRNRKISDDT